MYSTGRRPGYFPLSDIAVIRFPFCYGSRHSRHRTEGSHVDLWFLLRGKIDAFGVAATFDVEDAGFTPAVLIISDKPPRRIRGKRVFPLPERPKNSAVSPAFPRLAEQWMGKTSRAGKRKFITPKIDFFISPSYLCLDENDSASEIRNDERTRMGAVTLRHPLTRERQSRNSGLWPASSSAGRARTIASRTGHARRIRQ